MSDYQEGSQGKQRCSRSPERELAVKYAQAVLGTPPSSAFPILAITSVCLSKFCALGRPIPVGPTRKMRQASIHGARDLRNLEGIARNRLSVGKREPCQNTAEIASTRPDKVPPEGLNKLPKEQQRSSRAAAEQQQGSSRAAAEQQQSISKKQNSSSAAAEQKRSSSRAAAEQQQERRNSKLEHVVCRSSSETQAQANTTAPL